MITALCIGIVIFFGIGLWNEISEQRRVGHMAKSFKAQKTGGKKA